MKPHHVRVHALRVNRVAADLAKHRAARVGNRLLDQWFSSCSSAISAFMLGPWAFRPLPTMWRRPVTAIFPRIEMSIRSHKLASILARRLK